MLSNLLNYFQNAPADETLQAACFAAASERYLSIKFNGNYTADELSAIAVNVARSVRREMI